MDTFNPEKDASEEELERIVFGDNSGFLANLKHFDTAQSQQSALGVKSDSDAEDDEGLENLADGDLFFLDEGPAAGLSTADDVAEFPPDHAETAERFEPAAWEDSDDERITISLASAPRLRRLRISVDEDTVNGKVYAERLRQQYERLYPAPEWAVLSRERARKRRRHNDGSSSDSGDDSDTSDPVKPLSKLLQGAQSFTKSRKGARMKHVRFQAGKVDIQRVKDVPTTLPYALTSLAIHPTLPLLLASGPHSTLSLYHIDPDAPEPNPLLTSLHIKRTPLTTTSFHPLPTVSKIYLGAQRRYFHIWNLDAGTIEKVTRVQGHGEDQRVMEHFVLSPDGKYLALKGTTRKGSGVVNILNADSCQWVAQARINDLVGIADFAWWSDSRGMSIVGKNGEVTEWSVVEQRVLARWHDEGAVGTTVLALGGKMDDKMDPTSDMGQDRWVAVGSQSGIVNIYDRRQWMTRTSEDEDVGHLQIPERPSPVRVLDQLVTPTSHLKFSPGGQILAMASRWKRDALRLIHLPSCTVFRNWPTQRTPLGRISAVAWGQVATSESTSELMLATANEKGCIRLYKLMG